jgi:lipoprotein-anchoring transpeptidase ErfK/SrfK
VVSAFQPRSQEERWGKPTVEQLSKTVTVSRRTFLAGAASFSALALAGCTTTKQEIPPEPTFSEYYLSMYAAMPYERFPVPAVDLRQLAPSHFRTDVVDPTGEPPGTLVVDTAQRYLYLVQEGGRAIRYGIGVGRDGFSWSGRAVVGRKAEWPVWTPPPEMIRREPELEQWRNGMPPGLDNPLGARALYIYQDGRDTLYRLHGNPEVRSIGNAVSSGCVRLLNQDVIDLYNRVPVGTKILVA